MSSYEDILKLAKNKPIIKEELNPENIGNSANQLGNINYQPGMHLLHQTTQTVPTSGAWMGRPSVDDNINIEPQETPSVIQDTPEDIALKNALNNQLSGLDKEDKTPKLPLSFGNNQIGSQKRLEELQKQAQNDRIGVDFMSGIDRITAGLLRTKPTDNAIFDAQRRAANQPLEDYEAQLKNQKNDPNSTYSRGLKSYLTNLGFKLEGSPSAEDLEKLVPLAVKQYENQEGRQARREDLKLRLAELNSRMAQVKEEKRKVNEEKRINKENDWITRTSDTLTKNNDWYDALVKIRGNKERIKNAINHPSGVADVTALYTYIESLDPKSTVREGEVKLGQQAISQWSNIKNELSRWGPSPRLLNQKFLKDVEKYIHLVEGVAERNYSDVAKLKHEQARSRGITEDRFKEFDPLYKPTIDGKVRVEINGKSGFLPKENLSAAKSKYGDKLKVLE